MVVSAKLSNSFFGLSPGVCRLGLGVKKHKSTGKLSRGSSAGQVVQGFAPFFVRHFYLLRDSKKVTKKIRNFFYHWQRGHL